jgi:hypothetical protein
MRRSPPYDGISFVFEINKQVFKPSQQINEMKKSISIATAFLIALFTLSGPAKTQTFATVRLANAENRVAILPITYIGDGNPVKIEEMRYRLQNIVHDYLRTDAMELKFQDPAETNALLIRNGVNESNLREFTPKELAKILNVEYVLMGSVSQDYTGEATVTHTNRRDYEYRGRKDYDRWHRDRRHQHNRHRTQTTGYSKTRQELATNIDLDIYNDKGENIFSKSRRSILSGVDAYKYGIQYLLKRSPLYKR